MSCASGDEDRPLARHWAILSAAAVVLAAFLAHGLSLDNDFVWDDVSTVLLNEHIQDPAMLGQLFQEDLHAFGRGQGNFYRPLQAVSYMLDYAIARPAPGAEVSPTVFHLHNILCHTGGALLLLLLLRRLGASRFVASSVALLFAAHPLAVSAVAYISGRADPMAAFWMFAGLNAALVEGTIRRRIIGTALTVLCFVLALLSKESALIFPVLLVIVVLAAERPAAQAPLNFWQSGRIAPVFAAVAVAACYGLLRATLLNFGSDTTPRGLTLGERAAEFFQALALYMQIIFAPHGLHMERTLKGAPLWLAGLGVLVLVALAVGIAFALRTRQRRIAAGLIWFTAAWLPISGIVPLNAPMAEHWMYVPMAGLLWAAAELLFTVLRPPKARPWAVAIIYGGAVVFIGISARQTGVWSDNVTLFRQTLAHNPDSTRVHYNLALEYELFHDNFPGMRRHYEAVLEDYRQRKEATGQSGESEVFWDDELEARLALGKALFDRGNVPQAADHFNEVLRVSPQGSRARLVGEAALGMGRCLLALGDRESARKVIQRGAEVYPPLEAEAQSLLPSAEGNA